MREAMKKLGLELNETLDTLGPNHRLARRTLKRVKKAKLHYKLELQDSYNDCKEYADHE